MYCGNCGREIDDRAVVCPHCGVAVKRLEKKKSVNGLGIAGFVVSLVLLWLGLYFCIASVVGLILSAVAVAKREKYSLGGLAIAGLVVSIVSLMIWVVVWIILGLKITSVI